MLLNDAGRMVTDTWHQIPQHYAGIELDIFQIMPNHIHGIIVINPVGVGPCAHPHPRIENGQAQGPVPTGSLSVSNVIERFKSLTTARYIEGVKNTGWPSFPGKLWQRSYHDRIIRKEAELNKIRTYICNNPAQWDSDENNIQSKPKTGRIRVQSGMQIFTSGVILCYHLNRRYIRMYVDFCFYLRGRSCILLQRGHLTLSPLKLGGIFNFRPQAQVRNMN